MAKFKVKKKNDVLMLPTGRSQPVADPWQYAYLFTGEKKIGKTALAIEGCEELVIQCDKPQLAYGIREIVCPSWKVSRNIISSLEKRAEEKDFPYTRVVVDGAGEWFNMCMQFTCRQFQVDHPSEIGYARAWHFLRDEFTDAVNKLLRLQRSVGCGIVFIAHSETKTKKVGNTEIEKIVPCLSSRCEEILNGKCDAWFMMDYVGANRVMTIQGSETVGAGHRIDGHFLTPEGERIREVPMGNSPKEALRNFLAAFNNEQEAVTFKEYRDGAQKTEKGGGSRFKRK